MNEHNKKYPRLNIYLTKEQRKMVEELSKYYEEKKSCVVKKCIERFYNSTFKG